MKLRAVLAYAFHTSPTLLRDATGAEIAAMVEVVDEIAELVERGR